MWVLFVERGKLENIKYENIYQCKEGLTFRVNVGLNYTEVYTAVFPVKK